MDVSLAKEEATRAELIIKGDGHSTPLANRLKASILKGYADDHMPGILIAGVQ